MTLPIKAARRIVVEEFIPGTEQAADITARWQLFTSIRERFDRPGVERGGCPRHNLTPVYARKFGEHVTTIFPHLTRVEASFTAEQLQAVTAAILGFKQVITGRTAHPSLAEQIVHAYVTITRPYFLLALLKATEDVLIKFIQAEPHHAPALDALFRVAGSEGLRDLIRLYDAHALRHVVEHVEFAFPDILAFVNIHERPARNEHGRWHEERYEVWCPGYDFAKEYHQQCLRAAQELAHNHGVTSAPALESEVTQLPVDLVAHFTRFVQAATQHLIQPMASE